MKRLIISSAIVTILLFISIAAGSPASAAPTRVALVMGNGDYESAPLRNPPNDARDMAKALDSLGFDVIKKINADREGMLRAVYDFGKKLRNADVGIFYYAGHGMQIGGANYLMPVGANLETESDVQFESVNAGRVLGKMHDSGNKLNIVILDACRDNPYARSFRSARSGLARMDAPAGTIIAYATAPGSVAIDGEGENGVYTGNLLENITRPDLSVQDMLMETGLEVMQETNKKQIPWVSSTPVPRYYLASRGMAVVEKPAEDKEKARLKVRTDPPDAKVYVNGKDRGRSPVRLSGLDAGKCRIRAEKEGFETESRAIALSAGRSAQVTLYLSATNQTGRLFVQTDPEGARVRIMNIGPAYHDGIELDPGRYEIEVSADGHKPHSQWIKVAAGEDRYMSVKLEEESNGPRAGATWTEPTTGMEFVFVPGACYQMGQTEAEKRYLIDDAGKDTYEKYYDDELPRHEVCMDGFWMGKTEVTRGQFRRFVEAAGYETDAEKAGYAWIHDGGWEKKKGYDWQKVGYGQTDNHPVVCVSWNDARAFADWLSDRAGRKVRLPTEAQWEYAARGGTTGMRFWGSDDADACRYANVADKGNNWKNNFPCDDGYKYTAPAGNYRPNPFGLHDMLGNVWEWCQDVYDSDAYSRHSRNNPVVTSGGSHRVSRGGSWYGSPRLVRCAYRLGSVPALSNLVLGFRLCAPPVR